MYEKTIGNLQRIFYIKIPQTPTRVLELLSVDDRAVYDEILNRGLPVDPVFNTAPEDKLYKRIPVDGYILSNVNYWFAGWTNTQYGVGPTNPAFETVPVDERFTFPLSFWLNKAYIYAPSEIDGLIRIFFS